MVSAFVLLPSKDGLAVHAFTAAAPCQALWKVPGTSITTARVSTDGEHLGVLDQAGKRATVYRMSPDGPQRLAPPITLPKGVVGDVVALHGATLYAAAPSRTPAIYAMIDGAWHARLLPGQALKCGKRVDELLLDGSRMIAVDNIVAPKFFIVFDIASDGTLSEGVLIDLPVRSAYEHVRFAALGERWVAVSSHGSNRAGDSEHLALFDRANLVEHACISREVHHSARRSVFDTEPPVVRPPKAPWTGLAFAGNDCLYIGWGVEGLGVLHLEGYSPGDLPHREASDSWYDPRWVTQTPIPLVRMRLEAPVVGVVTVPGQRGCFVLFPGPQFRWLEPEEIVSGGEVIPRGAEITF